MLPPLFEALTDVIALPVKRVKEVGVNVIEGATSLTVRVMMVKLEPAELLAQMV